MLQTYESGRFFLPSRCKIVTVLSLIVVIVEIISVYKWESAYYLPDKEFLSTSNILRSSGSNFLMDDGFIATDIVINKSKEVKDLNTTRTSSTANHANDNLESSPKNQEASQAPPASSNQLLTKLPGGRVRLSGEGLEELDRRLKAATDKKVILIWITMFGVKDPITIDAEMCGNCEVTYDHSKINDENVGAVLFHFLEINARNMPQTRNLKQLYIFWGMESTATLKVTRGQSLKFEDSFKFNDTMTYRRDSGFYASYENSPPESIVQNNKLSLQDLLKLKTKLALAIVSNCGYTAGAKIRLRMLKELNSLNFGFEGYGGCFGRTFPRNNKGHPTFHEQIRKYKFYFSFENAKHCKDYITEKFYSNAILSLSVPVVWGGKREDYEAVAPPGSFIFAEDFSSMKALSEYLTYLDGNDTAYLEYFRWLTMKSREMPQYGRARRFCHLCRALHGINVDDVFNPKFDENNLKRPLFTDGVAPRTVEHLIDWFYGEDNPECFSR